MTVIEKMIKQRQKMEQQRKVESFRRCNKSVKKGEIVFAGSSLMEYFPTNELCQNFDVKEIVYNRGVGGFVIDEFEAALNTLVLDLEPRKLFINIGTNDMNPKDFDVEAFIAKYEALLTKIKTALPKTTIYVMAYYPVNPDVAVSYMKHILVNRTNERINKVNAEVEKMTHKLGLKYIDVNAPLKDEQGRLKEEFSIDGVHFYPDGYAAILPLLIPYICEK